MAEQAKPEYCDGCPVAAVLRTFVDEYFSDEPTAKANENSLALESIPDNLTDEEWAEAARAFSMTDREAIRSGVSDEDIVKIRETLVDSLHQLGGVAIESHCPGPREIAAGKLGCQAFGSAIVYQRFLMSYEKYILGYN